MVSLKDYTIMLNIFSDLFFLQRIDYLIRTRATGSPKSLAERLDTSENSVYRLIENLKTQGLPIEYDRRNQTYFYSTPVKWNFEFIVGGEQLLCIKGGKNNFDFFPKLSKNESLGADLCNAFYDYGAQ